MSGSESLRNHPKKRIERPDNASDVLKSEARRNFLRKLGAVPAAMVVGTALTLESSDSQAAVPQKLKAKAAPPNLKSAPNPLARENIEANRAKLSRLTEKNLDSFKQKGLLVPLPNNEFVIIDSRLDEKWRWCRPWTFRFLMSIGKEYKAAFGKPIQINSALRTVERQRVIAKGSAKEKGNVNAASAERGLRQSTHLTGSTIDIAKKVMSSEEIKWMRKRLNGLQKKSRILYRNEFKQSVFHIYVKRDKW